MGPRAISPVAPLGTLATLIGRRNAKRLDSFYPVDFREPVLLFGYILQVVDPRSYELRAKRHPWL